MAKKKRTNAVKSAPHGKGYNSLLIIIVSSILIAIPLFIIGRVIYDSYMEAGVPIVGERFENDIAQEITEDDRTRVADGLNALVYVDSSEANLHSATLKVRVDMKDELTLEELPTFQSEIYNTIIGVLPVETYFSQTEEMRNYDLEVTMFNNPTTLDVHAVLVKNSMMAAPKVNIVSSPLDPVTTQQVLERMNEPVDPNAPVDQNAPVDPNVPVEPQPEPAPQP